MVKTSKENKVQYVAPKVKAFEVRAQRVICDSLNGIRDIEGDGVQEQSDLWG